MAFKKLLPGQAGDDEEDDPKFTLRMYIDGGAVILNYDLIIVGDPSGPHVEISPEGLRMMDGDTVLGYWQTDGDIFIGTDITDPAETYLAIFANSQTYNSESVSAGDMLIGDNSSGEANLFFDKSTGQIMFRGGADAAALIDTNGSIVAGDGEVVIDETGVSINLPGATIQRDGKYSLKFKTSGAITGSVTGRATTGTGATSHLELNADFSGAQSNDTAVAHLYAGDVDAPDYSGVRVTAKLGNSAGHLVETIIDDQLVIETNEAAVVVKQTLVSTEQIMILDQSTPSDPSQDSEGNIYIKGGNLIIQYNDGGTVRYKYLDLTGTGVTWTHSTTAP